MSGRRIKSKDERACDKLLKASGLRWHKDKCRDHLRYFINDILVCTRAHGGANAKHRDTKQIEAAIRRAREGKL